MNKHTPGPWTVTHEMTGIGNRQVWGVVVADTGEAVANCGTTGEGTARFIVSACNVHADLLAALEDLLLVANVRIDDPRCPVFDYARAAIARAKGEA